ncbi:uncharacterized protein VTP21DRAFT_3430 [Calcarisporiella thermophila]|uniref:uncharacterized protein n=1 Tax=Calcarisporiella thermophila TaxID=911321 RepID=UPI0037431F12
MPIPPTILPDGTYLPLPSSSDSLPRILPYRFLVTLLLGQLLSLCITATNTINEQLHRNAGISVPTTQIFLAYVALAVGFGGVIVWKQGWKGWWEVMRIGGWRYILLGFVDVQANYFINKAFSHTTILSAMLIDSWSIPCVVLLSRTFLRHSYHSTQYLGVAACLLGLGLLIWSDVMSGRIKDGNDIEGKERILGDLMALVGATCYAISNVAEEWMVRGGRIREVVGGLGLWGAIISGIQLVVLERNEILAIPWTFSAISLILVFDVALVCLYSLAPVLFCLSSATFFNLSLLTSDFYGLLVAMIFFHIQANALYFLAFLTIVGGIFVYNMDST